MPRSLRPWPYLAGAAIAALGAGLLVASRLANPPRLEWIAGALVLAGVIELAAGLSLRRHGGAWMAHLFSGALVPAFALFLLGALFVDPRSVSPPPVALVFGVFCIANAIFRGLDLLIDKPQAAVSEAIDVAVTLVLGVVLLAFWRSATVPFVALVAGFELIAGGASLAATAGVMWRHPDWRPYEAADPPPSL